MSDSVFNLLSKAQEDYLEAIYSIFVEKGYVQNKDIAEKLNVARASVTGALKQLSSKGLINYKSRGEIILTCEGLTLAKRIEGKHVLFFRFFSEVLGIDYELADKTACKMEHIMDDSIYEKFQAFMHKIETCSEFADIINKKLDNN